MKPYYEDESVTLYHGDCREVLRSIPSQSCHAVVTDPPYGVDFGYGQHQDESGGAYVELIEEVQPEIQRVAPVAIVTPGISNLWLWPPATWVICWHKPGAPRRSRLPQSTRRSQGGFNEWEPVLVYGKAPFMSDVLRVPALPQRDTYGHPCPKPVGLLNLLVAGAVREGETVLDPFAGSGTTLIAARNTGRKSIGVEVDERYCEIIAKRLSQDVLDFGGAA